VRPGILRVLARSLMLSFVWMFLVSAFAGGASGLGTSFWTSERESDFRSGTSEHISIRQPGAVLLAPKLDTLVSSEENYFWCLARDERGYIYAGSGDSGKVYRIDPRGEVTLLTVGVDLEVLCLAVDKDGRVFAGTAPRGLIQLVRPNGESSVFFDTKESYVWCLTFDKNGNLYAGTGDEGRVYKIKPDGSGELFYETGERHVTCALYRNGELTIGTEGSGLVMSLDETGRARVLYDCDEEEVRDLAAGPDGVTYAAAIARTGSVAGPSPGQRGSPASDITEKKRASSVYRIYADGTASKVWGTSRSTVYSLWLAGEDSLFLGTGDEGRIYCLNNRQLELVDRVGDSQVLDVMGDGERFVFCTGNSARIYSAGPGVAREGTLTSRVFDTANISRWGALSWDAVVPHGTSLKLQTRSGNCENPDKTWSDWSEPLVTSGGVPDTQPGRFVQWRARLDSGKSSRSPLLQRVSLAYAGKNLQPVVTSVRVMPQGIPFSAGGIERVPERVSQTLPGGIRVEYSVLKDGTERVSDSALWARTIRTATWEAFDPNGDEQTFSVYYRGVEANRWKLISEDIEGTVFTWNTSTYPDGSYVLRVVSSDSPDNIPGEALSVEAVSPPFDVDNTAPSVLALRSSGEANRVTVTGSLSDEMSPLVELHYSLDGEGWVRLQSTDGLIDSREETFSLVIEGILAGEHTITIRVADLAGNVGSGSILVGR